MKAIIKTPEEIRRDELVLDTRHKKEYIEGTVLHIRRRQKAMSMLPAFTTEYKQFSALLEEDKCTLALAMRNYETVRETLGNHCQQYHLAGNTFISAMELLEILADK